MNAKTSNRWWHLAVGFFGMLFAGILYAWSILKSPLPAEFAWTNSDLSFNFTLVMCFFCLGSLLAGSLSARISSRTLLFFSAALVVAGFSAFANYHGTSILALYLLYGVCLSCGIGVAYNVIISTVSAGFSDKKGLCSGILMMGFGASTLLMGNVAAVLIASEKVGWRMTYILLGAATGLVLAATGILLPCTTTTQTAVPVNAQEETGLTTVQMLKKPNFWRFFLFAVTNAAVGIAIVGASRDVALAFRASSAVATMAVGILSICNGLGRIMSGFLFDAVGRRTAMLISGFANLLAPVLLLAAIWTGSVAMGIVGICIAGIAYGSTPALVPSTIYAFYGRHHFSSNFSVATLFLIPASFSSTVSGNLAAAFGSYRPMMIFLLAMAILSLLLNVSVKED